MDNPPRPTKDDGSYAFVCYSHEDAEEVMEYLSQLSDRGLRVWFDEGISPGESWSQEIADAINDADTFLFFVTPASVGSTYCQNELQYALARRKRIVAVHLKETPLPGGLELNLGASQAILAYRFDRTDVFERLTPALRYSDLTRKPGPSSPRRTTPGIRRLYTGLGLGLVLLTIGLVGSWQSNRSTAIEGTKSIAVLPLNNYAGPTYDYLADGLADGLITQLSKLPEVRVASRASSFSLKKSLDAGELDVNGLRDRLSVQHMLEGSIMPGRSNSFLVSVRIVNVRDDRNIWSGEWDTDQTSLLRIQSDIAHQVAGALFPSLDGVEAERLESVTLSSEAYDAYLKGRDALRKSHTRENLLEAERQFDKVNSLDKTFAGAYVGRCELQLSRYRSERDPLAFALAQKACNQALALQPDLWEARLGLGSLYRVSGEYERSLEEIDIAAEGQPDEATIFTERGWTLDALGRQAQAEQAFVEAIKRDPSYWRVYMDLGGFYFNHVQYDRALELYREALDLAPGNPTVLHNIGSAQLSRGEFEDALRTFETLRERLDSPSRSLISNIGTVYYNLGCFEESATFQQQAVALAPNDHDALGRLAESCRFIGDRSDSAFRLWRRAIKLAETSPNQASWSTRGLLAVYRAHVGEFDEAIRQIEVMWSLAPEASIAYFFEAIVLRVSGDEESARVKVRQSLDHGFPPALMAADPDLNSAPTCSLPQRAPLPPEICRMDR